MEVITVLPFFSVTQHIHVKFSCIPERQWDAQLIKNEIHRAKNCLNFSECYHPGLSGRNTGNLSPISCVIYHFVLGTSQLQRERERKHLKNVRGCRASQWPHSPSLLPDPPLWWVLGCLCRNNPVLEYMLIPKRAGREPDAYKSSYTMLPYPIPELKLLCLQAQGSSRDLTLGRDVRISENQTISLIYYPQPLLKSI